MSENKKRSSQDKFHTIRELEQQKIILKDLNQYLHNKVGKLESEKRESVRADLFQTISELKNKLNETITKSEELEFKLEKSIKLLTSNEKRYRDLYDGSTSLLRTIDLNGIIVDCNNKYAEHLGFTKNEVIGKSVFDHVTESSITEMRNIFESWKSTGNIVNREIWFKKKDGTEFPALLSANNIFDEDDNVIGSNTSIQDITEIFEYRKKLEESRNKTQQQFDKLKKLDMIKDDFLAMITHELKTPLVPIKSYIDMILTQKMGPLNDIQKERLSIVQSSADYMLKLVSDLLDAQKIELGQLKLTKDVHDLAEIINNTLEKMNGEIIKKGMSVDKNIQNNLFCLCDLVRIEQVLTNLLVNAIKFGPKEHSKILVKTYSENDYGRIVVKDNGIGIIRDNLEKIFVKFYQIDASTTREYGGTGLGLSVCKGLIEAHGGKIWAESDGTNKGAEIHILLPLVK